MFSTKKLKFTNAYLLAKKFVTLCTPAGGPRGKANFVHKQ